MKLKTRALNVCISTMAAVGILCLIGCVGNVDYGVAVGETFSISCAIKPLVVGILLLVPAVVREVLK